MFHGTHYHYVAVMGIQVRQKHISDGDVVKVITKKLVECPGISFFDIANQALELGRKQLAIKVSSVVFRKSSCQFIDLHVHFPVFHNDVCYVYIVSMRFLSLATWK